MKRVRDGKATETKGMPTRAVRGLPKSMITFLMNVFNALFRRQ
jgi:hypothetical protein